MIGRIVSAAIGFLFAVALYFGLRGAFVQPLTDANEHALDACRPHSDKKLTDPQVQATILDCYHAHGGAGTLHFVTEVRIDPKG